MSIKNAIIDRNIQQLKNLIKNGTKLDYNAIQFAASLGYIEVVECLVKNYAPIDSKAVENAASKGHLKIVQYLISNGAPFGSAFKEAASNGHLEVLKYLISKKDWRFDVRSLDDCIIYNNQLEILKYIIKYIDEEPYSSMFSKAAKYGRLEILKYLVSCVSIPRDDLIIRYAIEGNKLEIIKYLVSINIPIKYVDVWNAASSGYLDILKYFIESGTSFHIEEIKEFDIYHQFTSGDYLPIIGIATKNGHTEVVKYLKESGAPVNSSIITIAAENGRLEVVKYFLSVGAPIDEFAIRGALRNDYFKVVKYLLRNNAPFIPEEDVVDDTDSTYFPGEEADIINGFKREIIQNTRKVISNYIGPDITSLIIPYLFPYFKMG